MKHAPPSRASRPTFLRKSAQLFLASIALAGVSGCDADIGVTGPSPANPLDSEEQALADALNNHRTASGVPTLSICASLNVSASAHSDDMRDKDYQSDVGLDGSTTMSRACAAGYAPGCSNAAMAEVIASGSPDPAHTLSQWQGDATAAPILVNPSLTVMGVGRTFREDKSPIWTIDFGGEQDSSCQ